jgi:cytochrome P450
MAPGPKGLLFYKSLIDFYRDPIQLFAGLHKKYGNIVRLQGGQYCAHLITQPEHIKHVLQDNAKNYRLSGIFDETAPVVGKGLTTNNGISWLKQRRMVQTTFNHKHIPTYGETIVSIVEDELQKWDKFIKLDKPLNIDSEIRHINLRILGRLLFSFDFKESDPFLDALRIVRKVTIDHARSIIKLPGSRRFRNAVQLLDDFTYRQITARRNGETYIDILSMLMDASDETGKGMTDIELHDEIMTLFFAAYEDVANATSWTWYLLSKNPDIESALRTEIHNVLGDRPPTAADILNLPYLSMTANEVLRLYPTTWSLLREAIADDEIGGFHIPAGSTLIFDLHLTHRLPEYWERPERFDPEHFSPERSAGRPRFAYFPFGGGPRQCIGNELALMEFKLILARMIQLYRFELISKIPIRMNALSSLQPRGGVWVKAKVPEI